MCDDLIGTDDDFWNHPSLLQYATISAPNNTNHQNTNNSNNNYLSPHVQNPRKRRFSQLDLTVNNRENNNNFNKRSRISPNTNCIQSPSIQQNNNQNNSHSHTNSHNNNLSNHNNHHNNNNNNNNNEASHEAAPECNHKLPMIKRVTRKQNANRGRAFWCCSQAKQNQCKSFLWDDQWQNTQRKLPKKEKQFMRKKSFLISTELICISPLCLVEVGLHPPEQHFVDQVKKCNNAHWNPEKRKWVVPLDQHSKLIQTTRKACGRHGYVFKMDVIPSQVIQNVAKWKAKEKYNESDTDDCIANLPLKLRNALYEFQKEGVRFAIDKGGRCLIADEMGLGKSIQAIAVAYHYQSSWPLLVITPSSLTLTWKMELLKWLTPAINGEDINIIRKVADKMLKYDDKLNMNAALCPITIVSYGLAVRKQAEISDNNKLFGMVICDESHALKNYKTQRCKILLPLIKRNVRYCLLLSGTPTNNRPSELWTQIDALRSNDFMSFKQYSIRYCEGQQSRFGWIANGAMHLKELHSMIKYKVMIRRTKKEVLTQLPDKIRTLICIECDKRLEKKIKQKMVKNEQFKDEMMNMRMDDGVNEEEKHAVFDKKNKTMLALYSLSGMSKIKKICEYVIDLYDTNEKFLIFAHHLQVLDAIQECVENKCKCEFIRIDGKTSPDKRQLLVDKFQENEGIRIAILSITAAGTGLTLTAATSVVFAELYWGPTALLQCEDRAHRIGQKSTVNIIYLLGKGSLDDVMWKMIKKKMDVISKTLTGKQIRMEVEQYQNEYIKNTPKPNKKNDDNHNSEKKHQSQKRSTHKKQKRITQMLTFTPIHKKK